MGNRAPLRRAPGRQYISDAIRQRLNSLSSSVARPKVVPQRRLEGICVDAAGDTGAEAAAEKQIFRAVIWGIWAWGTTAWEGTSVAAPSMPLPRPWTSWTTNSSAIELSDPLSRIMTPYPTRRIADPDTATHLYRRVLPTAHPAVMPTRHCMMPLV
jgi:hypothetical protein